jgi:LmbE family N-acetylglucosaminyl deacetylase
MEHKYYRSGYFFSPLLFTVLLVLIQCNFAIAQGKDNPRKCIMVFGAHADDVDEIAGGTFAKYIDMGYEGVYVCVTNNLAGCNLERTPYYKKGPNFTMSDSPLRYPVEALETRQIRSEEAMQAAAVYRAVPVFLDFCEPELYLGRKVIIYASEDFVNFNPPGRRQISLATRYSEDVDIVVDLLRKYQPEIVITHTLGGEKLDHEGTAYMMYLAFKKAKEKNIPLGKLWMTVNGWLLDEEAQKRGRGKPDIQIDVKDYLKTKYEALNKHVSQNGGFGRDYVLENKTQPKEVLEEFITVLDYTK